jgi:taurine dioxygenase
MKEQLVTIQLTALTPDIGVDMTGVDLEQVAQDPAFLRVLRRALEQHLLVRIRAQRISPATMTGLAGHFGPLLDIRRAGSTAVHVPGHDMIKVISNEFDPVSGRPLGDGNCSAQVWHSDSTIWEVPTGHIAFYCRNAPNPPPATRFMNMIKVYETLPRTTKERIRSLRVMHHLFPRQIEVAVAKEAPSLPLDERRVGRIHPLVRRHIVTNQPSLFLPVRRDSLVVGWSEQDSRELLEELWEHTDNSPYFATAAMEADDFVIWDNTATVHSRDGWSEDAGRTMWHVSAEGEVPTPRYGGRAPNTIGLSPEEAKALTAQFMQTMGSQ